MAAFYKSGGDNEKINSQTSERRMSDAASDRMCCKCKVKRNQW